MCCGRWPKPVRNRTVKQVQETLDEAVQAVLRAAEGSRPVVDHEFADAESARRPPARARSGAARRRAAPRRRSRGDNTSCRSCGRAGPRPSVALTIQLNTRDGQTLCQGSWRTFFQPLTTSSCFSISARKRGISRGSSWRSASRVMTNSPRAAAKPAFKAAALPKLRRKRMPRTRGSAAARRPIVSQEPSLRAVVDEDRLERRSPAPRPPRTTRGAASPGFPIHSERG